MADIPGSRVLDFRLDIFPPIMMGPLCPSISSTHCIYLSHQAHSGHLTEGV